MSRTIGIDLGTTYSCAAVVAGGQPQVVRSRLGYSTIPSIVTFDDSGNPLVGQPAERRMVLQPAETIYGSKRLLGRAFLAGVLEKYQPHFQYRLVADEEGFVAAHVCGRVVSFVEVASLILREIRRAAEQGLGTKVDRAVVTVPAYFNENQRSLVREAGHDANLDVIRIINEPTAAALCFGFNRNEKKRLLVFDLGGGTFDVSIVELENNVFKVIGTDGDTFLGGLDFDRCLVESYVARLGRRLGREVALDAVGWQRLRLAAQELKHQLSTQERGQLKLPRLTFTDGTTIDLAGSVSREEYEAMTQPLVDRTLEVAKRALSNVWLRPADIDEVLLVGGQTRMPVIHRRVCEMFGREPTQRVHPDEVVALGAAIAASLAEPRAAAVPHPGSPPQAELRDVVPMPIGVAEGALFRPVIARNTPVPYRVTTRVEVGPGKREVKIAVYQGERPRAAENEYLGTLVVDGFAPATAPRSCALTFELDHESLLTVRAHIEGTDVDRVIKLATQETPDQALPETEGDRVRSLPLGAIHATAPKPSPTPAAPPPQGWLRRLFGRRPAPSEKR